MLQMITLKVTAAAIGYTLNFNSAYILNNKLIIVSSVTNKSRNSKNIFDGTAIDKLHCQGFVEMDSALPIVHYIIGSDALCKSSPESNDFIAINSLDDIADLRKDGIEIQLNQRSIQTKERELSISVGIPDYDYSLFIEKVCDTPNGLIALWYLEPAAMVFIPEDPYPPESFKPSFPIEVKKTIDQTFSLTLDEKKADRNYPVKHYLIRGREYGGDGVDFIGIDKEEDIADLMKEAHTLYPLRVTPTSLVAMDITAYLDSINANADSIQVVSERYKSEEFLEVSCFYLGIDKKTNEIKVRFFANEVSDHELFMEKMPAYFADAVNANAYFMQHPTYLSINHTEIFDRMQTRLNKIDAKMLKSKYAQYNDELIIGIEYLNTDYQIRRLTLSYSEKDFSDCNVDSILEKFNRDIKLAENAFEFHEPYKPFLYKNIDLIKSIVAESLTSIHCKYISTDYKYGVLSIKLNSGNQDGSILYRERECKDANIFLKDLATDLTMIWLSSKYNIYGLISKPGPHGRNHYNIYENTFMGHLGLDKFWNAETLQFNTQAFLQFLQQVNITAQATPTPSNTGVFAKRASELEKLAQADVTLPFVAIIEKYKALLVPTLTAKPSPAL